MQRSQQEQALKAYEKEFVGKRKIWKGIAALGISKTEKEKLLREGYFIFVQNGQQLWVEVPDVFLV